MLVAASLAGAQEPAAPGRAPEVPPDAILVDGVAAVVGRETILLTDVEERLRFFENQLAPAARDTLDRESMRREILEGMIDDHLLVAEASRAGIEVTTGEVTAAVETAIQRVLANFPSPEVFEEQLAREGLTISQLRQSYREIVRRQLLAERVVERQVNSVVRVTEPELRAFFAEHRGEIPELPASVALDQILVLPAPSDSALAAAGERIAALRARLAAGEPFADLARVHSEAPGADRGGLMGTFGPGDLDPAYAAAESAALALRPGEVSDPVRTPLGLHLLLAEAREGDRVRARQIVIRVAATAADSAAALARAREAVARARAGEEFAQLAREYSSDVASRERGGRVGVFETGSLGEPFAEAVRQLQPGEVTDPIPGPMGWQIIRLAAREGSRAATFEDVAPQLRRILTEQKTAERYQRRVAELREKNYVRVVRSGAAKS